MAYLKLMMDEKEIAHLSEDGQSLCANEDVPQYSLPLNLFIGDKREVPLVDVVVWAKKRIFPKNRMDCKEILKMMGLPELQCLGNRQTHQRLPNGRPLLAAIQRG